MARRNLEAVAAQYAAEYEKLSPKEQGRLRLVRAPWDFEHQASRKLALAARWLTPLARTAQVAGLVAVMASVGCVYAVYARPAPLALVSFPDGSLRCAQPNFDPDINAQLARTPADTALCAKLEPPQPLAQSREQALPGSTAPAVPAADAADSSSGGAL